MLVWCGVQPSEVEGALHVSSDWEPPLATFLALLMVAVEVSGTHCDPELAKRIGEKVGEKNWREG